MTWSIEETIERAEPRAFSPKDVDDLPEKYKKAATRMIQFHANSEVMGALLEKPFIRQAPSLDRKLAYSAKVQDEIGHAQLLYRAAETLGVKTREEMIEELAEGKGKFLNCFHYPLESWPETAMIAFFVDGAAMRRQATLKRTSWEPYAHAMDKICFEEGFHVKHGEDILRTLMNGSKKEQEMTQEIFNKWWPRIVQFFGPRDDESKHHDFAESVGLKTASNDELRQAFFNAYIPKAKKYGLEIPDYPPYEEDEDGNYHVKVNEMDWDEFWTIAKNDYEGSHEQITKRADSVDAVEWVTELLDSYEKKSKGKKVTA